MMDFGPVVLGLIVASFFGALVATIIVAWRKRTLFISDVGTVLLAPAMFLFLGSLRPEFQVGFGMEVWPFVTLVFGCLLFGIRVVILDCAFSHPRKNSIVLCTLYVSIAVLGGLFMPPLYE
ncbi:MAG: hypothetical protein JW793_00325 [Acidobacteria bacterium]|nr:hypothetical protein [Acidobacteriota bacterium]